jgi:HrpA-like RNA helicase
MGDILKNTIRVIDKFNLKTPAVLKKKSGEECIVKKITNLSGKMIFVTTTTGSGKSSYIPASILYNQFNRDEPGKIVVSIPRREALNSAFKIANDVLYNGNLIDGYNTDFMHNLTNHNRSSDENEIPTYSKKIGKIMGNTGGGEDEENVIRSHAKLLYMIDAVFLRELQTDVEKGDFNKYSHIIIDEIHLMTSHMRQILTLLSIYHEDLFNAGVLIILMSATVSDELKKTLFEMFKVSADKQKENTFSSEEPTTFDIEDKYIGNSVDTADSDSQNFVTPILKIIADEIEKDKNNKDKPISTIDIDKLKTNDKIFKVKIIDLSEMTNKIYTDYKNAQPNAIKDFLIFLPTSSIIDTVGKAIEKMAKEMSLNLEIIKWMRRTSTEDKKKITEKLKVDYKIILATNVADTGVTLQVGRVIDPGLENLIMYDPLINGHVSVLSLISENVANQRRGRVGRISAGTCFRLYKEELLEKMKLLNAIPSEIYFRSSGMLLANIKNKEKMGKVSDEINKFTMDNLTPLNKVEAMKELYNFGLVDPTTNKITPLGEATTKLQWDPFWNALLVIGARMGFLFECCLILALGQTGTLEYKKIEFNAHDEMKRLQIPRNDFIYEMFIYYAAMKGKYNSNLHDVLRDTYDICETVMEKIKIGKKNSDLRILHLIFQELLRNYSATRIGGVGIGTNGNVYTSDNYGIHNVTPLIDYPEFPERICYYDLTYIMSDGIPKIKFNYVVAL